MVTPPLPKVETTPLAVLKEPVVIVVEPPPILLAVVPVIVLVAAVIELVPEALIVLEAPVKVFVLAALPAANEPEVVARVLLPVALKVPVTAVLPTTFTLPLKLEARNVLFALVPRLVWLKPVDTPIGAPAGPPHHEDRVLT